jgi:hypothetical protein
MARNNDLFRINGAKEIAQELDELSRGFNNQIIRPGLRQGAAHLRKIAKKIAPKDDGHLRKAIQSKVITAKGRSKGVVARVGVLKNTFTDENGVPVVKYAGAQLNKTEFLNKAVKQGDAAALKILTKVTQEKLTAFHQKRAAKAAAAAAKR